MRWWIGVALVLLLSGCGGMTATKMENGGIILHSPTESVYYSPNADSHQTMTLAQARKALPELLLQESSKSIPSMELNLHKVTKVRIRRSGRIEISTSQETFVLPLKDLNVDLVYLPTGILPERFVINLTDKAQISFIYSADEYRKSIANALYVLKRAAMSDEDDTAFAETARAYREAKTKPVLPEAARRLRVQAEDAVQDKNFEAAADLYEEATDVVPWWPAGHFNYAVILSETGDYGLAAREMKRYLLLVPDAADAQAAQDNIYKWERKAGAQN